MFYAGNHHMSRLLRQGSMRQLQTQCKRTSSAHMQADLEAKAAQEPPRLGRHRFEAPLPQVLASDDVTGSLRSLRAQPRVARDRFKSLQKRGVIQVRAAPARWRCSAALLRSVNKQLTRPLYALPLWTCCWFSIVICCCFWHQM